MKISAMCVKCLIDKQYEKVKDMHDEEEKMKYMRQVLRLLYENIDKVSTPVMESYFNKAFGKCSNERNRFTDIKKKYNNIFLKYEDEIYDKIIHNDYPIKEAIKYAAMGNYIDFGVNGNFQEEKLKELFSNVENDEINKKTYSSFINDIYLARRVVYLTDNCGEVVFDKIFIKVLKMIYADLDITVIVRGEDIVNDVSMDDAKSVGLDKLVNVIGNGTDVAGTPLDQIDKNIKSVIESADLIISKGQGNFETVFGNQLNVYYIFLCKCEWFMKRFNCKRNESVFLNDNSIQKIIKDYY